MKTRRFNIYAAGIGGVMAITSPGIALAELPIEASGAMAHNAPLQTVEFQKQVVKNHAGWRDLVAKSFCGTQGSGADSESDRVWFEFAADTSSSDLNVANSGDSLEGISSIVAQIRGPLSLNVKELAEILKVRRPTVYAWMRGEQLPQDENRKRLLQLLRVAKIWSSISNKPIGKAIRTVLDENGRSLVDELNAQSLDFDVIEFRMKNLAMAITPSKKSVLDIAKDAGIDLSRVQDQRAIADTVGGKRMHED